MNLTAVLEQVRIGDTFYRESKPEILNERIGALIERNGLSWAKLEGTRLYCESDAEKTATPRYLSLERAGTMKPAKFRNKQ